MERSGEKELRFGYFRKCKLGLSTTVVVAVSIFVLHFSKLLLHVNLHRCPLTISVNSSSIHISWKCLPSFECIFAHLDLLFSTILHFLR